MAKLDDVVESLNIKLTKHKKSSIDDGDSKKVGGYKRRAWLVDEFKHSSDSKEKGSINPIDQPLLLTPLINPIDQPLLKNGSEKGVYKPLNLSLKDLRGNPMRIAQYLFEMSMHKEECITSKVTQFKIMKALTISKDSARTGLRFLLKNKLVKRVDFQIGKSGWSKYKLKIELFNEFNQAYIKGFIGPLKILDNVSEQKGSNSSNYIIKTTTSIGPLSNWDEIDLTPLDHIGLNKKHLLQLKAKNSPEIVQESINHFAYGLQFNAKTQKYDDPLSVIIGVLRKGKAWFEPNYKSPQEICLENILEEKKQQQQRILALEEELIKFEFEEWYLNLPNDKKEELTKEINSNSFSASIQEKMKKGHLFQYFKSNVKSRST